jgi:hypothetical protein
VATFLVFLLCGQPVLVTLDTPESITVYAVGSMPADRRDEFMYLMGELVESGQAKRADFKVEEQTKDKVCGTST